MCLLPAAVLSTQKHQAIVADENLLALAPQPPRGGHAHTAHTAVIAFTVKLYEKRSQAQTLPSGTGVLSHQASRQEEELRWRGPGVGGCELRKRCDSSQFRGSVPMPTRQSVRCAPSLDSTLGGARRKGTVQTRRQTDDALESSWYQSNVERAGALSPMMDGSNSSLQARSPCTTAAVLCFPAAMPTHLMPSLPILAHATMHS